LTLDTLGILDVSAAPHALQVFGDSNDLLNLSGNWTSSDITGFTRYESGQFQVDVANGMGVIVDGVVALGTLDGSNGFRVDGPRLGSGISGGGDVNGDGFADIIIGAPRATSGNLTQSGLSYVVFGGTTAHDSVFDLATLDGPNGFRIDGAATGDRSGTSVGLLDDFDGDGFDDLLIGAPLNSTTASYAGAGYVVFHAAQGAARVALNGLDGNTGLILPGANANDYSGRTVSALGDFNGDGYGDLAVIADRDDGATPVIGSAYVVFGSHTVFGASLALGSLNGSDGFRLDGSAVSQVQTVARAGDINGDGLDDLIIGGSKATTVGGSQAGTSFVVFGTTVSPHATIDLGNLDGHNGFHLLGLNANDHSGISVSGVGDFNGDGFDDFVIGASDADPHGSSSGSAYLVFGKASFNANLDLGNL
jgi:hypothetical protein